MKHDYTPDLESQIDELGSRAYVLEKKLGRNCRSIVDCQVTENTRDYRMPAHLTLTVKGSVERVREILEALENVQ